MSRKKVLRKAELAKSDVENISYVNVDLNSYVYTSGSTIVVSGGNLSTSDNLMGILSERNTDVNESRKAGGVDMKGPKCDRDVPGNVVRVQLCNNATAANSGESKATDSAAKQKIPRPPNAFMIFANKMRKKLAVENPKESNKDISVRLGALWKSMSKDVKEKYFAMARQVDAEHKRKYPDYVYNPKEARLRKAMREQSRELSRQSILQTTIASPASESAAADCVNSSAGNFSHPHPLTCATPPASPLSGTSSIGANRIIGPWFPVGHAAPTTHLKPILTPRVMAAHQRTIDKTKEVIRKQLERPVASSVPFPGVIPPNSTYPSDFSPHGPLNPAQENNDYCMMNDLTESQKWHSYQNGANSYHLRSSTPKLGNIHCNVPTSPHRPSHWGQFCSVPMANPNENTAMRSPRHLTYLQEQQSQHCATPVVYPDDMQIPYRPNQIDVNHRAVPSYQQQEEHRVADLDKEQSRPMQVRKLEEPPRIPAISPPRREAVPPLQMGPSSVSPTVTPAESSSDSFNSRSGSASPAEKSPPYPERLEPKSTKSARLTKQPLPGFHQAFGSTEIGRFSRSEFFANMISDEHSFVLNGFVPTHVYPFPSVPPSHQNVPPNPMDAEMLHQNGLERCFCANHVVPNCDMDGNYITFLDYSHHVKQEWHPNMQVPFFDKTHMMDPQEFNHCRQRPMKIEEGLDLSLPDSKKS